MSKKDFKRNVDLGPAEVRELLMEIIRGNDKRSLRGKKSVAVEVIGHAGLGKTSIIQQISKEMNKQFVKINLAQLDELGDITGFPQKEFEVVDPDGKTSWETELMSKFLLASKRGTITGKTQMGYALPEWISQASNNPNGGLLLLDDTRRAQSRFLQAVMEIVDRGEYYSWKLPPKWTVVLTNNPSDSEYLVAATDIAQQTRYASVSMKFDKDDWAKWAELDEIDDRCINFILMNPEVIEDNLTKGVNPRSMVNFFHMIENVEDFSSPEGLSIIQLMGEAAVGQTVTTMFTQFIHNKLDKLPSPDDMLFGNTTEGMKRVLSQLIGVGGDYRGDLAYVLSTRIVNRLVKYSQDNPIDDKLVERMEMIIASGVFNQDVSYTIARTVYTSDKQKFRKIIASPKVMKYITK